MKYTTIIALTLSSLSYTGCQNSHQTVINAKVWSTTDRVQYFPEQSDPEYQVPKLRNIKNNPKSFGIAFSGGGTRSASATLGQLRMLHKLGWIDNVLYISAVSGGSWTSVPYTYLPDKYSDRDFLSMDIYKRPNEITDEALGYGKEGVNFSHAIRNSAIMRPLLRSWGSRKGDEAYADVLNHIFLEPFSLGDTNKLFTWNSKSAQRICQASTGSNLTSQDFYTARAKRPYLLVGGTVQKKHKTFQLSRLPSDIYPFVMTPHYAGIPTSMNIYRHDQASLGGGYIEAAGYDSLAPKRITLGADKSTRIPLQIRSKRYKFTLSDVIAVSGSAPQGALTGGARYLTLGLASNLGLPEHDHWPVIEHGSRPHKDDLVHGDGGNLENTGLHALLSRRVKNIMIFVNSAMPFNPEMPTVRADRPLWTQINHGKNSNIDSAIEVCFRPSSSKPYNQVFKPEKFEDIYRTFANIHRENIRRHNENQSGMLPLVHYDTYKIQRNHWHSIEPYTARICWVYLYAPPSWTKKIPIAKNGPSKDLRNGKGKFRGFPHYKTFLTQGQGGQLIDLSREQVNALANLSSWTLETAAEEIRRKCFTRLDLKKP